MMAMVMMVMIMMAMVIKRNVETGAKRAPGGEDISEEGKDFHHNNLNANADYDDFDHIQLFMSGNQIVVIWIG